MKYFLIFNFRYCRWFTAFFENVVQPHKRKVYFYGMIGAIREFSSTVAFFIPLKMIMVLSNPSILDFQLFSTDKITMQEFIYFSVFWFFTLLTISFLCHMVLPTLVHKNTSFLWPNKKSIFPSRTKYRNLYQLMVDSITHLLIIFFGLFCVLLLDMYLFVPLVVAVIFFIVAAIRLAKHTKNILLATPLKDPKLVFKLISDIGFSITFIFIIVEYFLNDNMNFLFTLLSLIMSRIILRNIQQLFVKHRRLFDEHYQLYLTS